MRVRTDFGALATGGVIAAVLSVISVGDGAVHGVGHAGSSLDTLVLQGFRGALTYGLLFLLAHIGLRRLNACGRWTYAGAGALCASICVASQAPAEMWALLSREGRLTEMVGVALMAGAVMGFSYRWRAGLEAEGDDPARLAEVLGAPAAAAADPTAITSDSAVSPDGAVVDTGSAEYFNGPLQVRTAAPVAFVAALLASGSYALILGAFGFARDMSAHLQAHANDVSNAALANAFNQQLFTLLTFGLFAPLPFAGIVLLGHSILRGMNRQSYGAYVVVGAIAPVLISVLVGPLGILYGVQAVIPMAIAMATYRSMAGVEPKAVKEDTIVRDRRDLVGSDHARRSFGRLVRN